jgi:hypothetical protein
MRKLNFVLPTYNIAIENRDSTLVVSKGYHLVSHHKRNKMCYSEKMFNCNKNGSSDPLATQRRKAMREDGFGGLGKTLIHRPVDSTETSTHW